MFNLVCDRQYLYGLSFVAADVATTVLSPLAGFLSDRSWQEARDHGLRFHLAHHCHRQQRR
ncbi:hypothetical protein HPB48_021218 [Haemaphysalis longicornis]|uniref:Uncharacterized protein n=1 Tax=Haemaphysalis longicornis TaxID=44386 RepID=A0A9J6GXZ7_HAELO|nr:hypothetical protein HPB48_021218 [Haemaphysalis longicornis]